MSKPTVFFLIAVLLLVFQNCSNISFSALQPGGMSLSSSNNGTGYSGKPDEDFYRFHPEFTCEQKPAPVSHLHISAATTVLTENKQLQCGAVRQTLDSNMVDRSIYQNDVVGFREGIFESETSTPQSIPANLVEVWCRTAKDKSGIETLTYYDRTNFRAETEIYSTATSGVVKQTLPVSRVLSAQRVSIRDGKGFSLEVYRDRPAAELGLFQADLEVLLEGQRISRPTTCRLGGSLDPLIWPSRQIVDNNVQLFKIASDRSYFGYTSTLGTASATRLFSASVTGEQHRPITGPMLQTGVTNFEFTPSLDSFVFWGDARYAGGPELFRVGRQGEAPLQLNAVLTNSQQGNASDIQFSPDGKQLFYRDGQQETGSEGGADIELWLRSVPLVGGAPSVINMPLELVGDHGVYHFEISKEKKKIAYLAGQSEANLFISDLDGKNVVKPLNSTFYWYETFSAPPPGEYLFIRSKATASNGKLNTTLTAVAFDGSGSKALPQNWELGSVSPSGTTALIYENGNSVIVRGTSFRNSRLMDLPSGSFIQLPSLANARFTKDGSSIIGSKVTEKGDTVPWRLSLKDKSEIPFCADIGSTKSFIKEYSDDTLLVSAYDEQTQILRFYLQHNSGECPLKNSLPFAAGDLSDIQVSDDRTQILVKATHNIAGKLHDQMYLVPLNGKPPMIVNSAVYTGAKITNAWFLKDSRTILYVGDQITPSEKRVFLWKSPTTLP